MARLLKSTPDRLAEYPGRNYRLLQLVLILSLIAVGAAGCGGSSDSSGRTPSSASTATPTPAPTSTPTPAPTASALWVPNSTGNSVDAYALSQLPGGGNLAPAVDISGSNTTLNVPTGLCFDKSGNLWVVNEVGSKTPSTVTEFAAANLTSGGNIAPAVTISGGNTDLEASITCTFDSSGNLWVVNDDSPEQLTAFSPTQLSTGGNLTPVVTLGGINTDMCNSDGLILDGGGNAWVSGLCLNNLVEFTPSKLASGGNIAPASQIVGGGTALNQPVAVTFDAAGNLWVANSAGNGGTPGALEFAASDLPSGGNVPPAVTVAGANTMMNVPNGVAFDPSGNLWVSQGGSNALTGYKASDLVAGGNITPFSVVSGVATMLDGPFTIKFH